MKNLLLFISLFSFTHAIFASVPNVHAWELAKKTSNPLIQSVASYIRAARIKYIHSFTNLALEELGPELEKTDWITKFLQQAIGKWGAMGSSIGALGSGGLFFYTLHKRYQQKKDAEKEVKRLEEILKNIEKKIKNLETTPPEAAPSEIESIKLEYQMIDVKSKLKKARKNASLAHIAFKSAGYLAAALGFALHGVTMSGGGKAGLWLEWLRNLRVR